MSGNRRAGVAPFGDQPSCLGDGNRLTSESDFPEQVVCNTRSCPRNIRRVRSQKRRRVFLSYNKADVEVARNVGAHLTLAGVDVWFDEWKIKAGDSIPGRLNEGLKAFDAFLLLWSAKASRSGWVRQELNSAVVRAMKRKTARVIPCVLDSTTLPPLVAHRRFIDFRDRQRGIETLLAELVGDRSRRDRLMALQHVLSDLDVTWHENPAVNPILCCPRCGEEHRIEGWQKYARDHEGHYSGLRCLSCGWEGGGEV